MWTKKEEEFLITSYPNHGYKYCANKLNKSVSSIKNKCFKLKLVRKKFNKSKITIENYLKPTPETSYIMGLIWADGHIGITYPKSGSYQKCIDIELTKKDAITIADIMKEFCVYTRNRQGKTKVKTLMGWKSGSTMLYDLLDSLDYKVKSGTSACKVLNHIPKNLHQYWWMGYFHGDGYIKQKPKGKGGKIIISSCYEQDWTFCENLFQNLKIKYSIHKKETKNGNSSRIAIYNRDGIKKFGNFIYSNYDLKFGYKRKYNEFLKFKQKS